MASEKLALKTTLYEELHHVTKHIEEIQKSNIRTPDMCERLSCLEIHRNFVLKLITICVDRNKF